MPRKKMYPGLAEAEEERRRSSFRPSRHQQDEEPDWTPAGYPNYEKFEKYGWDCEKILVHLNID